MVTRSSLTNVAGVVRVAHQDDVSFFGVLNQSSRLCSYDFYISGTNTSAQRSLVEGILQKFYFFSAKDLDPRSLGLDVWTYRQVEYRELIVHMLALGTRILTWDVITDVHQVSLIGASHWWLTGHARQEYRPASRGY